MRNSREFGVQVNWGYGSTSTATKVNYKDLFQIQFNIYMPSSQYDQSIYSGDEYYTCHSRVLTFGRDEIPCCSCSRTGRLVKGCINFVFQGAYEFYDPCLRGNMSQEFCTRIARYLTNPTCMPLVRLNHIIMEKRRQIIAAKILSELVRIPKDWSGRIPIGFFINVDIYFESVPCTPSAPAGSPSAPAGSPSAPAGLPSAPAESPSAPAGLPSAPAESPSAPAGSPSAPAGSNHLLKEVRLDRICSICVGSPSAPAGSNHLLKEVRLDRICSICWEEFDKDVGAACLTCSHIFHRHCIVPWLQKVHKCPLCRKAPKLRDQNSPAHCGYTMRCKVERKVCAPHNRCRPSLLCLTFPYVYFEPAKNRVCIHQGSDDLQIQINLQKNEVDWQWYFGEIELGIEARLLTIPNGHREKLKPAMIKKVLQSMCLALHVQEAIVAKIFEVIANNNFDDPYAFINVDIYEETYFERVTLYKSCGICKDDFSDGALAASSPCSQHIFHKDCILTWLKTDNKCPLCLYPLPKF